MNTPIQQFRIELYQSIVKRRDAGMNLLDAITTAGHVQSPVSLSEEPPFQRKFSSIFDTLQNTEFDFDSLLQVLHARQGADWETIAGYEVYAIDCTPNERPEATAEVSQNTEHNSIELEVSQLPIFWFILRMPTRIRIVHRIV